MTKYRISGFETYTRKVSYVVEAANVSEARSMAMDLNGDDEVDWTHVDMEYDDTEFTSIEVVND